MIPARDAWRFVLGDSAWTATRRIVLTAAVLYAAAFAWTGRLVGAAGEAFWKGDTRAARALLERAAWWGVRNGRVQDALGVVLLADGEEARGAIHLARARSSRFHPSAFGEERVLTLWIREGRLEAARLYAEHRRRLDRSPRLTLLLGAAEAALGRFDEAERHLRAAKAEGADAEHVDAQLDLLARRRSTGRLDRVVDRRGNALVWARPPSWTPSPLSPGLASLLDAALVPVTAAPPGWRARLALDLQLQRAAEAALGRQRGALVVIDVATGGILAAASQPPSSGGRALPAALAARYEAGSIIKMITLEAALRAGTDVKGLFPMHCPGWAEVDGVIFRDWMPHRRVDSIEDAVAVSCNVAFGRLAERVGRAALDAEMARFGFSGWASGSGAAAILSTSAGPLAAAATPVWPGADLRFEVGTLREPDPRHPIYALWRRAVGLDTVSVTPLHAALLAAGLARGGVVPAPRLVEQRWSPLGPEPADEPPVPPASALPEEAARLLRQVMRAAVTSPRGTARRAAAHGVEAAVKTGTSGRVPPGYDALVIGFAPADHPVIAWALIAERAGKAEWEGARITREFLTRAVPLL